MVDQGKSVTAQLWGWYGKRPRWLKALLCLLALVVVFLIVPPIRDWLVGGYKAFTGSAFWGHVPDGAATIVAAGIAVVSAGLGYGINYRLRERGAMNQKVRDLCEQVVEAEARVLPALMRVRGLADSPDSEGDNVRAARNALDRYTTEIYSWLSAVRRLADVDAKYGKYRILTAEQSSRFNELVVKWWRNPTPEGLEAIKQETTGLADGVITITTTLSSVIYHR